MCFVKTRVTSYPSPEDVDDGKLDGRHSGSQWQRSDVKTNTKSIKRTLVQFWSGLVKQRMWEDWPHGWGLQLTVSNVQQWSWCLTCDKTTVFKWSFPTSCFLLPTSSIQGSVAAAQSESGLQSKAKQSTCIQTTLKRSGMDHTVQPAKNTMPAFAS